MVKKKYFTYFLVVIFFPLTNLVDVEVLFIFVGPPEPFENELLILLKEVKPPGLWKKSSMRLPPIPRPKPNGLNKVELTAFCG